MLDRVQNIIQRQDNIKINTVFNGEFVSGNKRANKSVSTRNYELFQTLPICKNGTRRAWSVYPALLEEFQECDSGWTLSSILNLTVNKYNPLQQDVASNSREKLK